MTKINVNSLAAGLCEIPDADFVCDTVYEYLRRNPVDVDSLTPYLHWNDDFYTRNLIFKDERFEMMAICWEKGQASKIHNHADQRCWMTVPIGKLRGQNFSVEEIDIERGHCKLMETNSFDLMDCLAAAVDLEEPVHQVLNLPEFDARAVSIHIYSKPFDTCLAYCREDDTVKRVQLFYTSIDGKLCDNVGLAA